MASQNRSGDAVVRGADDLGGGRPSVMNRRVILAAGFLVLFIGGGARFAIGLTLKPIAEELGVGRTTLGLAVGAYFMVTSASMFLAGRLADAISLRLVLGAGLLISAAGMGLLCVLSEPWQVFAYFGVIFALGNGIASITPVSVMVSRAFPDRAGFANGIVSAGMSAGQLVIIGAFAVILAHSGWRAIFFWGALAHLALLPILVCAVPASAQATNAAPAKDRDLGVGWLEPASRRPYATVLALARCLCPVRVRRLLRLDPRGGLCPASRVDALLAGHLLALMGLVGFVGVIAAGAWSDKAGPVTPAVACFCCELLHSP